ncbi:MAG: hypothetical protein GX591_18865, partial [Planctomycetes bacterium]|nr:hypothetical protein [Planctomycetota bacterium]
RLQKHFFNGGAMTPEAASELYQARVDEIWTALMGESARWGDFSTPYNDDPLLRDVQWLAEYDWLMNSYFPVRANTVLEQFRSIGLYPAFNAPQFSQHGGLIHAGDPVSMTGPDGRTIYYTLDGSDPRDPGAPGEPGVNVTLVAENAAKRVLIPTTANGGDLLGTSWLMGVFNDSGWTAGTGGVGYDRGGTNYDPYFAIDVESAMYNVNTSAFIRIPFTVSADDLGDLDWMTLGVRCDDGFVAYLNGVKIAEDNNQPDAAPGVPLWNNGAVEYTDEGDSVTLRTWNVNAFLGALQEGDNVLAIHGLNAGMGSSDFLLSASLTAGGSSGTPGGVSPTAVAYNGSFELDRTTTVKARAYDGATWSALTEAVFTVDASADLRITEINYHPHDPTAAELAVDPDLDDNDFEFIELANVGTAPIGLSGVKFTNGIDFDFSASSITTLNPGQYVVVVADPAAFTLRYGSTPRIAGTFSGSLNNAGERITLADDTGAIVHDFAYADVGNWPGRADGKGSTLEIIDTAGDYDDGDAWRSSEVYGGTPGAPSVAFEPDVVINEVLTHTDEPQYDAVELLNVSDHAVDLGGWVISDSSGNYAKFAIPAGTVLQPGQYVVFDEQDFNLPGDPSAFALDGDRGDDVWLLATDAAGRLVRFVDHAEFGAALNGESFGRTPNGSGDLVPMVQPTLGSANAAPRVGPVIVSEVMYNPDGLIVMPIAAILDEDFAADAGGFIYADDVFGTGNPIFADGTRAAGGWLEVTVGRGAPEATSGGWSATFSLSQAATVTVTLDVRLRMSGQYGLGDSGEAVLAIDGVRYGPADDFSLIHVDGDGAGGADVDTGWVTLSVPVTLEAGDHTLTLAAYNNVPSEVQEFVTAAFDNVTVTGPLDRNDLEYVEIYNPTAAPIDLTGWRLREGIDYDFDDGTILPAGGRLVVLPFDPEKPDNAVRAAFFRSVYGLGDSAPLVGGWAGRLNNAGERIELQRPGEPPADDPDYTPHTIEDDVAYGPDAPWPASADGLGDALDRVASWGRDGLSWAARTPSPGSAGVSADFDFDGDVDLDDFVILKQNFGLTGTATLAQGDATGDRNVDLDDFVILKQTFGTAAPAPAVAGQGDTLLADATVRPTRDSRTLRRHRARRRDATAAVDLLATMRTGPLGR